MEYTISELFRLQPLEAGHELYGNCVRQAEHTAEHRQPAGTFSTEKWHIPAETSSYAKQSMKDDKAGIIVVAKRSMSHSFFPQSN